MKKKRLQRRSGTALLAVVGLSAGCFALQGPTQAQAAPAQPRPAATSSHASTTQLAPSTPKLTAPGQVLAPGWKSSKDRAVEVIGDDNGLNVMVADAKDGYTWQTAASLSEPGFDSSQWIGNACVTGSGRYAAVVYGPWSFSNSSDARDRGGFAAIVDLDSGAVRKLNILTSMAYYSPGCGTGEQAAFSALDEDATAPTSTSITLVNAATGTVQQHTTLTGEVTSPVPYDGGVAAALGNRVIQVNTHGASSVLSVEKNTPLRLHPDADHGLAYEVPQGKQIQVKRYTQGHSVVVTTAAAGAVQLQGSAGHVYLVGPKASTAIAGARSAGGWQAVNGNAEATASTLGQLLVTEVSNKTDPQFTGGTPTAQAGRLTTSVAQKAQHRIAIRATVTSTGKAVSFTVDPSARAPRQGSTASPALSLAAAAPASAKPSATVKPPATAKAASLRAAATTPAASVVNADDSADPARVTWDPVRGCAVARNDPKIQTFQANAAQIEWAADLAVQGQLTTRTRGVNWEGSGMPISWTPQGMFPLRQLDGGGTVPAQVLLGLLAQESNTLQASPHAVDSVTGNANQGGFYGGVSTSGPPAGTTWSSVDCGYGVGQVTTGMTIGYTGAIADASSSYTVAEQQQAIATDYASNVAASLNLLIDKWNQLYTAGVLANGGDPEYVENWYFALWAYNTGVEPSAAFGNTTGCAPGPNCTDGAGNWGLGWTNNPADPTFAADRADFTAGSDYDTSHPQYWPYQERVLGWAATPVQRYDYATGQWVKAYASGLWQTPSHQPAEPAYESLCTAADSCIPSAVPDESGTADSAGKCAQASGHCWWNQPQSWTNCALNCGVEKITYTAASARPSFTDIYPPDGCTSSGLPTNAVIVDTTVTAGTCSGTPTWQSQGTMSFFFPTSVNSACTSQCINYQGKIDFHQIGTGLGGHVFFTHMIDTPTDAGTSYTDDSMTATWAPPSTVSGWTRIKVHIPSSGATTRMANYRINLGGGQQRHRLVNQYQNQNTWLDLGSFDLSAGASVSLSNYNTYAAHGDGGDVAFDAVAFVPTVKPKVNYVALGDSYAAGDGLVPYQYGSNTAYADGASDYCNRSATEAYPEELNWPGLSGTIAGVSTADGAANFAFLACSGAQTVDLTAGAVDPGNTWNTDWGSAAANSADFGELPEIDAAGYLDPDTTLVTISVGGNDARFSDVLSGCIETLDPCIDPAYYLTRGNGRVDPQPLITYEPEVITAEQSHLRAVYQAIHQQAPNARVLVLGYPHLFPQDTTIPNCALLTDSSAEAAAGWMNTMSDDLNASISDAIKSTVAADPGMDISFVDVRPTFNGHEVCSDDPWLNGVVISGAGASFHPMAPGDTEEAAQLNALLN
ncbi:golvesin C-terminal-like domain-containing protein [Streptacidiphilus sp. PAMC 29251]